MDTPAPRPTTPPSARRPRRRRPLWILAGAIALGLLLFGAVMLTQRTPKPFYSAGPATGEPDATGNVQVFDPLPAPLPAGTPGDVSALPGSTGVSEAPPPRIIEEAPRPSPATPPPTRRPISAPAMSRSGSDSAPVPISQPTPRYPRAALRAGVGGTVQVQVEIGPDGVPTATSLVEGSGHRELDRAALEAVRRWRFRPATHNGQPTVGRVTVPIRFTPEP